MFYLGFCVCRIVHQLPTTHDFLRWRVARNRGARRTAMVHSVFWKRRPFSIFIQATNNEDDENIYIIPLFGALLELL